TRGGIIVYPQPILSDIEFDNEDLIIGFRDRTSDQLGDRRERQPDPTDPVEYGGSRPAGDVLRACPDGSGGWIIENDASCGEITTAGTRATNGQGVPLGYPQGPGGNEYYFHEDYLRYHDEIALGGLAQLPGAEDVAVTVFDVVYLLASVFDSGVMWLNNTTGTASQRYRVYVDRGLIRPDNTFGKANGLGDLELLCNLAPIEIGNYIWSDSNGNGVQDPNEAPIGGVVVNLYDAQGSLVVTTTTNGTGNYIFNADNVPGGLTPNTPYFVALDPTQFDADGHLLVNGTNYGRLTVNDTGIGDSPDLNDSDGLLGGSGLGAIDDRIPYIPVSLGPPGANNHTFDFGFGLPPPPSEPTDDTGSSDDDDDEPEPEAPSPTPPPATPVAEISTQPSPVPTQLLPILILPETGITGAFQVSELVVGVFFLAVVLLLAILVGLAMFRR
ncbi:MAG: SdrD B-like domain-containing protein, partial [Anaerolineae bacterium]|nr:SdrD B-like domain-containing protein [Anaerolineae bacterium]